MGTTRPSASARTAFQHLSGVSYLGRSALPKHEGKRSPQSQTTTLSPQTQSPLAVENTDGTEFTTNGHFDQHSAEVLACDCYLEGNCIPSRYELTARLQYPASDACVRQRKQWSHLQQHFVLLACFKLVFIDVFSLFLFAPSIVDDPLFWAWRVYGIKSTCPCVCLILFDIFSLHSLYCYFVFLYFHIFHLSFCLPSCILCCWFR